MENKCYLDASDYLWVRILPDDFYEDGIDAIWHKLADEGSKPVKIDDSVVYYRKGMLSKLTGKVVAIFPLEGMLNANYVYYADPYKKSK